MSETTTMLPKVAKTASWIEARIHKALAERRDEQSVQRSARLGFSQIGKCERNLQAELRGTPAEREPDGRILVLFDLGNAVEAHLIKLLERAGIPVRQGEHGRQIRVSAFDGQAVGHLDGEAQLPKHDAGEWAVLELKSAKANTDPKKVSPSSFEALEAAGSYSTWNPDYAAQLQVYMGLRNRSETLVMVECKNDSRLWIELVPFDPDEFMRLMDKAEQIVTSPFTLDRPAEAKSQYCSYCKYCERNSWCWGPLAGVSFDD